METATEGSVSHGTRKKKVLCPIPNPKDPTKTFWVKMGTAYVNKDNSINLYLDGLPVNGKLQVRDWDERDDREFQERRERRETPAPANNNSDLPF
jgi:hypothetical protein